MKANVPKKIYLLPRQGGDYAPYWKTDSQDGFGIEYVLIDAFIEKATKWINEHTSLSEKLVIENFRKYMEGE